MSRRKIVIQESDTFKQALRVLAIYWNYKSNTKEDLIKEIIVDLWTGLADVYWIDLDDIYNINSSKWEMI